VRIDFSIRFTRVRSKSLISKKIDRPQPVPSNQLDRPQALRLEAITHNSMFADYLHRRISPTKSATKLSKIAASSGTRQNPTLVIQSDQDRLDPEPGRTPAPRMGPVRVSRNSQNNAPVPQVNENRKSFCSRNRAGADARTDTGAHERHSE
jgi:hypothetical protein